MNWVSKIIFYIPLFNFIFIGLTGGLLYARRKRFEARLQKGINRHSALNLERIKILSELYERLLNFLDLLQKSIDSNVTEFENLKEYYFSYLKYFKRKSIFLPKELEDIFKKSNQALWPLFWQHTREYAKIDSSFDYKSFGEIRNYYDTSLEQLKNHMRCLIGAEEIV